MDCRSLTKLLVAAPLLLAACSAEVAENTDTSEAALTKTTPSAAYTWEESDVRDEVTIARMGGQVGVPDQLVGRADDTAVGEAATRLRPKFVQLSGSAPLTPAPNAPCTVCTR